MLKIKDFDEEFVDIKGYDGRFENMRKLNSQRMKENRVWESRWNNA